jgi:citrate lyase gamma subunit
MAALAVAEQITNAETPKAPGNDGADEIKAGNANASRPQVALLLCRPDVKSAAELKGLNVAINVTQSAAEQDIHLALAAVGATEVELSVSDASPLDRLVSGDVQAAVVRLVSPDAAEAFPDIKGFKVLRVPLSPH